MFWKLKVSIYCLIILLALEYKKQNIFFEKLFIAIVINNVYVLLFNNENQYSINDIFFVISFTVIQYLKNIIKWLRLYLKIGKY
jgi:hypothetical protein